MVKSYEMMLDFYGITLSDSTTGKLKRSKNYKERWLILFNLLMEDILRRLSQATIII